MGVQRRVVVAPEAARDLDELYDFIRQRSQQPTLALNYIQRIRAACEQLELFPERGTVRDDLRAGLRTIGFEGRATIYFLVLPDEVRILRIAYGGRQIGRP